MARNRELVPIFVTIFIDLVGVGIVFPILAPLFLSATSPLAMASWSYGTRTLLIGLLAASYPLAQFFGAPFLGAASDRWGRKPVLLISLAGTLVGYLFFALAIYWHAVWLLFVSRALDGFTGGNISTANSAIADLSSTESKARNFGLVGVAYGMGFIIGPYLGGKLADPHILSWFNLATPFWFAAGMTFVNILLVVLLFKETLRVQLIRPLSFLTGFSNLRRAFTLKDMRTMFFVVFLFTAGFNFYTQFFQVLLIEKFNYTQSSIGDLFGYIGVWIALTQGIAARAVSRRWTPEQVLPYALFLFGLTLAGVMLPDDAWVIYIIGPFMALAVGLTQPNATAIVSNLADRHSQGEILGVNQSVNAMAMTLPPIISGIIVATSIYLPLVVATVFVFASWGVFVFRYKRSSQYLYRAQT